MSRDAFTGNLLGRLFISVIAIMNVRGVTFDLCTRSFTIHQTTNCFINLSLMQVTVYNSLSSGSFLSFVATNLHGFIVYKLKGLS